MERLLTHVSVATERSFLPTLAEVGSFFMKKVRLSNIDKEVFVDAEDFELLNTSTWCALTKPRYKTVYARAKRGGKLVLMHREILGAKKGEIVDHINGNGLDNRKNNLRIVSNSQNLMNRGRQKNNSTGFCGVRRDKRDGRYEAYIKKEGRRFHLGRFGTPEDAAKAYDKACIKLHGEFARTNFSQD
jgi:hypothetical protein